MMLRMFPMSPRRTACCPGATETTSPGTGFGPARQVTGTGLLNCMQSKTVRDDGRRAPRQMSERSSAKTPSDSYSAGDLVSRICGPSQRIARPANQRANIFDAIGNCCALLGQGTENRIRESFELQFVGVGIGDRAAADKRRLGGKTLRSRRPCDTTED